MGVLEQVLRSEYLNYDDRLGARQDRRGLVDHTLPHITHLGMGPGQSVFGFLSVLAPLLFSGYLSLKMLELSQTGVQGGDFRRPCPHSRWQAHGCRGPLPPPLPRAKWAGADSNR